MADSPEAIARALREDLSAPIRGRRPRLHHYTVPVPGLDPAHDGLRIAHLSDLHVGILTSHRLIRSAVEMAEREKPDLVVMTGDFVCYSPRFVGRLGELVRGLSAPTVCVLGNHDYWTDGHGVIDQLHDCNFTVLRNQHTRLHLRNAPLTIVGLDDAVTGQADVERAFAGVRKNESRLILSHVPSLADRVLSYGPGLVVAGHTHGGHVHIPRLTAKLFHKLGSPYVKGFYRIGEWADTGHDSGEPAAGNGMLFVNCGIGSSSVPIRAGAPSELAILTLRPATALTGAGSGAGRRGNSVAEY